VPIAPWTDADSSNGELINASLINNLRADVDAYLTTGIPVADLATPEHFVTFPISFGGDADGDIPGDAAAKVWLAGFKPPFAFIPTQVDLYYGEDSTGSPTLSLDVKDDGTTFLDSGPLTNSTAGAANTNATNVSTIAANSLITLHLTNTAGAGNDARFVTVTIYGKAEHLT
jgi:hypothetical protein